MFNLFKQQPFNSQLFNETTFFQQFMSDLEHAQKEVIIESPFITSSRMEKLYPVFMNVIAKKIPFKIITRDPSEYDDELMQHQATNEILQSLDMGIQVNLVRGYHHRKLVILDRKILWEGSLNILSYNKSKEIMRRIESKKYVAEMITFVSGTID